MNKKTDNKKAPKPSGCDFCEYYDCDQETGQYECMMDLDQDEMSRFLAGEFSHGCRYFKFYDEYKSVQKQN